MTSKFRNWLGRLDWRNLLWECCFTRILRKATSIHYASSEWSHVLSLGTSNHTTSKRPWPQGLSSNPWYLTVNRFRVKWSRCDFTTPRLLLFLVNAVSKTNFPKVRFWLISHRRNILFHPNHSPLHFIIVNLILYPIIKARSHWVSLRSHYLLLKLSLVSLVLSLVLLEFQLRLV